MAKIVAEYILLTINAFSLFFAILADDSKLNPKSINNIKYCIMATENPNRPYCSGPRTRTK
ncbi:hypothetical protein VEE10_25440 [Escherichia coli]|nr:hypothetical protein VEE10_25440 [Escherichia coli]